ncbi:apolipoprotein C-I isoform X4 [Monodelphis domestica]|uniref:apolipoprotein C-I isoform X4 n=1 Tax=Monodelphis domestica TaxID=13616 RepID=UPI000443243A|nr:apolipoprotein C-I isoform X4 [Monodelphis domestica]
MYLMPGWSAKGAEAFGQSGSPLITAGPWTLPPTPSPACLDPGPICPRPAQASSSLAQSFEQFQKKVKEFTETVVEKTKAAITQIKHSDLPSKTRTWITENIQKVKDKVESTFKKH